MILITLLIKVLKFHLKNWSHGDIKPANILFINKAKVPWKLGDMGESSLYKKSDGSFFINLINKVYIH